MTADNPSHLQPNHILSSSSKCYLAIDENKSSSRNMSGSVPNPPCRLCNNLQRRILSGQIPQYRAAFDFSPTSLAESSGSCPFCAIILSGIRQFEPHICDTVVWIYARGPAEVPPQTLSLELYYRDSRPKLELELHAQTEHGIHTYLPMSRNPL